MKVQSPKLRESSKVTERLDETAWTCWGTKGRKSFNVSPKGGGTRPPRRRPENFRDSSYLLIVNHSHYHLITNDLIERRLCELWCMYIAQNVTAPLNQFVRTYIKDLKRRSVMSSLICKISVISLRFMLFSGLLWALRTNITNYVTVLPEIFAEQNFCG